LTFAAVLLLTSRETLSGLADKAPDHGRVVVAAGITLVLDDVGRGAIVVPRIDEGVTLPAGTYPIKQWTLTRDDLEGSTWQAIGKPGDPGRVLEIRSGETTQFTAPEPVLAKLELNPDNGDVSIWLTLSSGAGDEVQLTRDGSSSLPQLRVRNPDGNYDKLFQFEPG